MSRPGDLDITFGTDGKVTTDFASSTDQGYSVAIQTDGKIILGGTARAGTNDNFALARYNSNGSLDSTFGTGGKVTTDFSTNTDQGYSVAIQTDGKIILGGTARAGTNDNFALARYNSNGSLDSTFGTGGKVTTDFSNNSDTGRSVALQTDGKIILGGYARVGTNDNFALARYNSNGSLDSTFGTGGKVTTDFSNNNDYSFSVFLQLDGKIILGGNANISSNVNFALARYNSNGTLDTTFGVGGKVNTDFANSSDIGYSVALQTDGKIILGGYVVSNSEFALARYNSNGSLDTTFGTGGKVTTNFANSTDYGYSVSLQTDGKIILGGYASIGGSANFALARYHENGSLDTTFGTEGKVNTDFSNNADYGYSVAVQTDGKIILGGAVYPGPNFGLARYINNTFIPSKPFSYYINLNYTLQQIKDLNQYDAGYFKATGYTITQLQAINFTDAELKAGGYLIEDFKTLGYTDEQLIVIGYLIADFKASGYTIPQLKAINYTDAEIKAAGYLFSDFKEAEYTDAQIKAIGFLATDFKASGYTVTQLKAINYTDAEIKAAGYLIADFKTAGYTDAQLKEAGFTDAEIKFLYLITETSEQLDFIVAGSTLLANNIDDQGYTINVANKNYKYFNLLTNSYVSYNNLGINTNGILMFDSNPSSSNGSSYQIPSNSLRFFSFDAKTIIKYYFDLNDNLIISTTGARYNNINDTPFNIVIKIEPNGKITINYKSVGTGTYKPIIGWVGNNSSLTTDDTFYSTFNGTLEFNQSNINGKTLIFNFTNLIQFPSTQFPITNICFVENSIVSTDQGLIEIQNIKEDYHSINNNKIICLTKTVTEEPYLICIEKDAIYKNVPNQKTVLSYNHKIFYNNDMINASELLDKGLNVSKVRYSGEVLYNLLFNTYEKMLVNGLVCESLHPMNLTAQLFKFLKEQPKEYYHYFIDIYNKKYANATKKQ